MDWKYDKGFKTEITLLNINLKIPHLILFGLKRRIWQKLCQSYYMPYDMKRIILILTKTNRLIDVTHLTATLV